MISRKSLDSGPSAHCYLMKNEGEGEAEEAKWFEASVELANSHIRLVLDGSEYDFTAQHAGS